MDARVLGPHDRPALLVLLSGIDRHACLGLGQQVSPRHDVGQAFDLPLPVREDQLIGIHLLDYRIAVSVLSQLIIVGKIQAQSERIARRQ